MGRGDEEEGRARQASKTTKRNCERVGGKGTERIDEKLATRTAMGARCCERIEWKRKARRTKRNGEERLAKEEGQGRGVGVEKEQKEGGGDEENCERLAHK